MSFSEDHYISKLRRLNSSQRSIQTVSEWVMFHKKYSQESTRVWAKEMSEAPIDRSLVYLYLANEIIQTSRKQKITRFVESFATVLPETIKQAYEKSLDKGAQTKPTQSIIRLIAIWKERHIFDAKFFQHLDDILRKMDSKYDVTAAEVPTTPQAHSQTPSEISPSASPVPSTTTSPVQSNTSISSNPASSSFTWDGASSPADSLKRKREEESKEKQPVVKTAKTEPTTPTPTPPVATLSSYSQQSVLRVLVDAEQSYQAEELKYATRADEYLQQGVKAAPRAGVTGDRDRGGSEREAELKAWTSQLGAATVGLRAYKTFLQAQIKKRKQLAETLRMHHDTQESAASRLTQQLRLCNEKLTAWQDASANAATTAQQASSIVSPSYTHITRTTNHPASHPPTSPHPPASSPNQPSRTSSSFVSVASSSSSSSSSTPSLFAAASPSDILQARQAAAAEAERAEMAKIRTLPTKINHTITSQRIPRLAALASQTNSQVKIDPVNGTGAAIAGTSPTTSTTPTTTTVEAYSPSLSYYPQSTQSPPPVTPSAASTSTSTSSSTSSTSSAPRPIPVFESDDGDDTDKLNSYAQPLPSVNLDFAP